MFFWIRYSLLLATVLAAVGASPAPRHDQHPLAAPAQLQQQSAGEAADPSHLLFASFAGLMQQWPNTLYPNGHSFILGTIPTGTLVYHARKTDDLPPKVEWLALDAELSYSLLTGFGGPTYLLTYATARPMRVLVLDGLSGGLSDGGWLDTQHVLMYGNVTATNSSDPRSGEPPSGWAWAEYDRARAFCQLADEWSFDGVVRMNAGFEVIYCDFGGSGLELVSHVDVTDPFGLSNPERPPESLSNPPAIARDASDLLTSDKRWGHKPSPFSGGSTFEWIREVQSHSTTRPDSRVQLDPSTFISFYDPRIASLALKRALDRTENQRRKHRLLGITNDEAHETRDRVRQAVLDKNDRGWVTLPRSGVDWLAMVATVVQRYQQRLDELELVSSNSSSSTLATANATTKAIAVRAATYGSLSAYIDMSAYSNTTLAWLDSTQPRCLTAFTRSISDSTLTPSEVLLKNATESVLARVCFVQLSILAESLSIGLPAGDAQSGSAHVEAAAAARLVKWHDRVVQLREWLGWGVGGLRCQTVCARDEVCSMPLWPLSAQRGWGGDEEEGEAVKPACISRRTESLRR